MSSYKGDGVNTFAKVLTGLVAVLLIAGLIGGLAYILSRPQGIYLVYDKTVITKDTGGIALFRAQKPLRFHIENSDGWGAYSAADCSVTVVPNVDEAHDFEFTVSGEETAVKYSEIKDLTKAFCREYDGSGIKVTDDGVFELSLICNEMKQVLEKVYGEGQVFGVSEGMYLMDYPYFALSIISPDGKETLKVPFRLDAEVTGITLEPGGIVI